MNPTSCLLGSRFDKNHFFLLAVALLFAKKIRQSVAQFWFRLWIIGFLLLRSCNPKSNCCPLSHFWSTVRRKRSRFVHIQPEAFLYEAAQNFEVFSNIQDQNKKIKNI
jgi:hypothetical protein